MILQKEKLFLLWIRWGAKSYLFIKITVVNRTQWTQCLFQNVCLEMCNGYLQSKRSLQKATTNFDHTLCIRYFVSLWKEKNKRNDIFKWNEITHLNYIFISCLIQNWFKGKFNAFDFKLQILRFIIYNDCNLQS